MASEPMIDVENLTFTYPRTTVRALGGLDFSIDKGEIFGFLGPSGAGKSTTQKLLIGLLKTYGGSIRVMGKQIRNWGHDYFERVGVSFEMPNHYSKLTGRENLEYFQSLYSVETLSPIDALRRVGLEEEANKRVGEYSKGMKIRLNVARSFLHQPRILFLDEPTAGLDPVNARRIKDLVLELRSAGTTVFVTTHDMTVADELCDRVAFITAGEIRLIDAPAALKKRFGRRSVRVEYRPDAGSEQACEEFALDELGTNEGFLTILKSAERIETIHSQETTLENVFIEVTGQELTA